jgi:hypothetical protein
MPVPSPGPSAQPSSGHEKTWPANSLRFRSSVSSSSSCSDSTESDPPAPEIRPAIDPAEIARIRAKEPCDRTHAENDLLLAYKGLIGVDRPNPRPRTGIDPSVNNHTRCHGFGTLLCCARGKALCVPNFLGQEWLDQCGEGGLTRVAAFIARIVKTIPEGQPIGDPKKFWQNEWHREVNGATPRAGRTGTTPVDASKYAGLEIGDETDLVTEDA